MLALKGDGEWRALHVVVESGVGKAVDEVLDAPKVALATGKEECCLALGEGRKGRGRRK